MNHSTAVPSLSVEALTTVRFTPGSGAYFGSFTVHFSGGESRTPYQLVAIISDSQDPTDGYIVSSAHLQEGINYPHVDGPFANLGDYKFTPHTFKLAARPYYDQEFPPSNVVYHTVTLKPVAPSGLSASVNKSTVTVTGIAFYDYAPISVSVGNQKQLVVVNAEKEWSAVFPSVRPGTHEVSARVEDPSGVLLPSDAVSTTVTVADPVPPTLVITSPPENWPVTRTFKISGVATIGYGNVEITSSAGGTFTAEVSQLNGFWSTNVRAEAYYPQVTLTVRLERAGLEVKRTVQMEEFGEFGILRKARSTNPEELPQQDGERENLGGYFVEGFALPYSVIANNSNDEVTTADETGLWRVEDIQPRDDANPKIRNHIGYWLKDSDEHVSYRLSEFSLMAPILHFPSEDSTIQTDTLLGGSRHRTHGTRLKIKDEAGNELREDIQITSERPERLWSTTVGDLDYEGRIIIEILTDIPENSSATSESRFVTFYYKRADSKK